MDSNKAIKAAIIASLLMGTSAALANQEFEFSSTFDLTTVDVQELQLQLDVGKLDFNVVDNNSLSITAFIDGDDCTGDSEADPKVEAKLRGDVLEVSVDHQDCVADFTIAAPRTLKTKVEMGVGELKATAGDNFRSTVGVGEVTIHVDSASFSRIDADVGVGEVDLRLDDGRVTESDRWFVNESLTWRGDGEARLEVELGVGEISIREAE
ncbi:hypothetical protein [uncultured Umboniibacter sp.]|uniref:hypothetical protein n=1 Tax=uncultured Umboniibacter sp. TaxID=1798917 RepID=UPI002618CBF0|nr:hypothetical protein [uncultured Umboniibacter sp.]